MIQVLGIISQGQFIEESRRRDYNINVFKEAKKEVLLKTLKLLGCQNLGECDVKSGRDGDNFFCKNGKLIGIMQNFGSQKVLIQKSSKKDKKLATIQMSKGGKILMSDSKGDIIYNFNGSKKIKIRLEALGYTLGLEISN